MGNMQPPRVVACHCCMPARSVCRLGTQFGSPEARSCAGSSMMLCSALLSAWQLAQALSSLKSAHQSHLKTQLLCMQRKPGLQEGSSGMSEALPKGPVAMAGSSCSRSSIIWLEMCKAAACREQVAFHLLCISGTIQVTVFIGDAGGVWLKSCSCSVARTTLWVWPWPPASLTPVSRAKRDLASSPQL